ncbi:hypothetical protein L21SP2_1623 [Salinispira pacifica]|uniref:6-hydroxymethylpterin diphosphokinase MptE-like domain-containing protein n=2 Tax=Salinispira pacifica TaxID=1307761 RepID=V5WGW1_9SPIO|nr:hypothetical protein L21SP2_1623 [Salinispira pacifica]
MRDPLREAERVSRQYKECNYLIIIGGAGLHHIPPPSPQRLILLIIPDSAIYLDDKARPMREEILQRRDVLICAAENREDPPGEGFFHQMDLLLKNSYRPLFHPRLDVYGHPPVERLLPDLFGAIRERIQESLDQLHSDYFTQKRFGKMWFLNMLRNSSYNAAEVQRTLEKEQDSNHELSLEKLRTRVAGRSVTVLGAGPGLDDYLDQHESGEVIQESGPASSRQSVSPSAGSPPIPNESGQKSGQKSGKERPGTPVVIAADSALPSMIARGLAPDAVVSTDPQFFSLLHHIPGTGGLLLCDPGVHPAILRMYAGRSSFISTAHPLAHSGLFRDAPNLHLPFHFTQVGGSAGAAALAMGAAEVRFYGLDFSYPGGAAYARNSYQHIWAGEHAHRLNPAEHHFYRLVSGDGRNEYRRDHNAGVYLSTRFEGYRREFEQGMSSLGSLRRSGNSYLLKPRPQEHPTRPAKNTKLFRDYGAALNRLTEKDCAQFMKEQYRVSNNAELRQLYTPLLPLMYHMLGDEDKIDSHSVFRVIQFATRRISHIMML